MKKILTAAASALMFLFVGSGAAIAQDEEKAEGPTFVPVEAFACNFNDGKGPEDLAAVVAEWNAWMDEQDANDYSAITLWPNFYGQRNFDVGWLGVWPDGNAMGAGMDSWMANGAEMASGFDAVLDCVSHTQFATVRIKAPDESDDDGDDSFVLSFSNCSFEEDATMDQLSAAQKEWNAYADEHGFVGGSWMMWPVWGESADADYDFKSVSSAPNYTALGANWAKFADGHYEKSNELFEELLDCDSARVYTAMAVRSAEDDDD
jgi:hypothetical protein